MLIRTATAHADGSVCLVLDEDDHSESDSVILEYRFGGTPEWRRFDAKLQVDAVCSLPDGTDRPGRFVAMTADGDILDIVDGLPRSHIPGAGYDAADSLNRGNMVELELVGGRPTAMGFGGQVYVMGADGTFAALSAEFPDPADTPGDTLKFVSGTFSERQGLMYFVGSVVTAAPDSDAIEAANDAGDADLLVELMLAETRYDYGAVLTFDGAAWTQIDVPGNTEFDEAATDGAGDVFIREREGTVYCLPQPVEWIPVLNVDSATGVSGLTAFQGHAVAATETELFNLTRDEATPFEPAAPKAEGYFVQFGPAADRLYVFRSQAVIYLEGNAWATLEVPPDLAVLG